MIRVLIVDDHPMLRQRVAQLLRSSEGFEVVAECADGSEVLDAVAASPADVVLMDYAMPGLNGVEATRQLVSVKPDTKVLLFSGSMTATSLAAAAAAGASGYLVKSGDPDQVREAIRTVAAGGTLWPPNFRN